MNADEIRDINAARIRHWQELLVDMHSTAVIIIAVGHDHESGNLHVIMLEDLSNIDAYALLEGAARKVKEVNVP
jgi:hypothetical protein